MNKRRRAAHKLGEAPARCDLVHRQEDAVGRRREARLALGDTPSSSSSSSATAPPVASGGGGAAGCAFAFELCAPLRQRRPVCQQRAHRRLHHALNPAGARRAHPALRARLA
eukprot:1184926-Pleurochrysis_carterae.AAC.1